MGVVVNRREALKLEGGHSLAGHFARSPNEFAGLLTTGWMEDRHVRGMRKMRRIRVCTTYNEGGDAENIEIRW